MSRKNDLVRFEKKLYLTNKEILIPIGEVYVLTPLFHGKIRYIRINDKRLKFIPKDSKLYKKTMLKLSGWDEIFEDKIKYWNDVTLLDDGEEIFKKWYDFAKRNMLKLLEKYFKNNQKVKVFARKGEIRIMRDRRK